MVPVTTQRKVPHHSVRQHLSMAVTVAANSSVPGSASTSAATRFVTSQKTGRPLFGVCVLQRQK